MARRDVDGGQIENVRGAGIEEVFRDLASNVCRDIINAIDLESRRVDINACYFRILLTFNEPFDQMRTDKTCAAEYNYLLFGHLSIVS